MNPEPLIFMITVQVTVTAVMIYCFWKVMKKPGGKQ